MMRYTFLMMAMLLHFYYADAQKTATIVNFSQQHKPVTRFSTPGEAIDAHDGEIAAFNGVYYLYGTSYGCGFEWGRKNAPFCGFKVYSSKDLEHWTDRGALFDASTPVWQTRCNGSTYGCFRPHVIYNKKTRQYVLWINVYDNRVGFRVFTSKKPTGPFTEVAEPRLAVNSDAAVAGLNNGDHDTFVDDDGNGYIAYTDWRTKGSIVIERLTPDYLSGSGDHVKAVTPGTTEAPSLFRRNGICYLLYSDPNCGYCSGTGTSYRTAANPLGPWSDGKKISDNSCGGQPSFVSAIRLNGNMIYLFGSDLWNNAAKNEALANYYWAPLSFAADGSINPMVCQDSVQLPLTAAAPLPPEKDLDNSSGSDGFTTSCDISHCIERTQSFTAARSGRLTAVSITSFRSGYPDDSLHIDLYPADEKGLPVAGKLLSGTAISPDAIGWSPQRVTVRPNIKVTRGKRYTMVIRSGTTTGCYGAAYSDAAPYPGGGAGYSNDCGKVFSMEENRSLQFMTFVK